MESILGSMKTTELPRFAVPPTFKRTKIITTLGPSTDSYEAIEQLIMAGSNCMRLNFSHGTHEERSRQIKWIRKASKKLDKPVAIYQDLQGPKIRLGMINDNHYEVKKGETLDLVYETEHRGHTVPVQYDLSRKVEPGQRVYIFDGRIRTIAEKVDPDKRSITVRVENDGVLMSRKGINLPDTDFTGDVLTPKDYRDIDFGVTEDIDYVGLSFVHSAHDIELLRGYLADKRSRALLIAKIETVSSIKDEELESIIEASDAVMVARGDLAVEVGAEIVPVVQRKIISLCQKHVKISIVATQMMSSMVDNPEPTRAEVSDVSNAVAAGADCVMLSDETANGKYPLEAVQSMKRVILYTEQNVIQETLTRPKNIELHSAAISDAAVQLAKRLEANAIVAETKTGATTAYIAAHRPRRPIISVTSDAKVAQQLCLMYGTKSFLRDDGEKAGLDLAKELIYRGMFEEHSTFVLVSGRQPGIKGLTDTIRVRTF